jgi:hypothetical protein
MGGSVGRSRLFEAHRYSFVRHLFESEPIWFGSSNVAGARP